jgi:hypothetical protein
MAWASFEKNFKIVLAVWAVPAFVITVAKALVVDVPQIIRGIHIDNETLGLIVVGLLLTFMISFISMVVGSPMGPLFQQQVSSPKIPPIMYGWKRKHYVTALVTFVALWILQAKFPLVRGFLSIFGFSSIVTLTIMLPLWGLVYAWRKLPH